MQTDPERCFTIEVTWTPDVRSDGVHVIERFGGSMTIWGPLPDGCYARFVAERKQMFKSLVDRQIERVRARVRD